MTMRKYLALILAFVAVPAFADHPGDRLDEVMAQKEPAFRAVDLAAVPSLDLLGPDGEPIDLDSLSDQVIVLSFAPTNCGAPCVEQQEILTKVREGVNASPMLNMVTFLIVSDAEDLSTGLVAENVIVAQPQPPIETLIEEYRAFASDTREGPLVHVIARGNRHAGIFDGAAFRHINMILYVNGLTNEH